jgi:hypothetical protein
MPNNDEARQKELHIYRIIDKPLEAIESEHGLWGLDHVAEIVEARRTALTAELTASREKSRDTGQ